MAAEGTSGTGLTKKLRATIHQAVSAGGSAPDFQRVAGQPGTPVPATSQASWLRLAEAFAADARDWLRADAAANLLRVARAVGWAADWQTLRTRPTLAALTQRTGLARRTVQRWLRVLEDAGLLAVLEPGTTPRFRPAILHRGEPNLAREWLLADPDPEPVDESGTPTGHVSCTGTQRDAPTRARETGHDTKPSKSRRRGEWLMICQGLRRENPNLRRIPVLVLRHVLRPWLAAGYTTGDVVHALDRRPDGSEHFHTDRVRYPAGWLRSRMACWAGPGGAPLPPWSAEVASRAAAARVETYRAPARRGCPPPAAWQAARAAMSAR